VYASSYFPGTALLYLPAVWLGLSKWVLPLAMAGALAGMTYRVVTELIDGVAGLVAAVLIVSLTTVRYQSIVVQSHLPMAVIGVTMVWAWLHWRRELSIRWIIVIGALAGLAAITRPADAVAWAAPVGLCILIELRRQSWQRIAGSLATLVLAASPFLAVQVVFNVGVTGQWSRTPFQMCIEQESGAAYGFSDARLQSQTTLPQKLAYNERFNQPIIESHSLQNVVKIWIYDKLPLLLYASTPAVLLLILVPPGLLGLSDRRRWPMWLPILVFIIVYAFFATMLFHYAIGIAPAMAFAIVLGAHVLQQSWPKHATTIMTVTTLAILAVAVRCLPELEPRVHDDPKAMPTMKRVGQSLASEVGPNAVVLFRWHASADPHEEPVYNVDVAWPDDAPIIRAHDLGDARNIEIFRYFAERQPTRRFYRFDRGDGSLQFLGTATGLAAGAATDEK
jgi:4-amino-4-deoxy-L-arabinose transferase-like glycosyltransferase